MVSARPTTWETACPHWVKLGSNDGCCQEPLPATSAMPNHRRRYWRAVDACTPADFCNNICQ
jgi:hypothetical protein